MEITSPYIPRRYQQYIEQSLKRNNVLVIHRRAGKTVFCVNHLIRCALTTPNGRFAYIGPQRLQIKGFVWDFIKYYTKGIPVTFNENELRCDFPNGSRITLYGVESPDNLRGNGWDGVVLDECQEMTDHLYSTVISPALLDKNGWCIFVGTPKGRGNNLLYSKLKEARTNNNGKWFHAVIPVTKSQVFTPDQIEEERSKMAEEAFNQEFMCSFDGAIAGAYFSKELSRLQANNQITSVAWDKAHPVHTAWDLGVSDSTAIWFFQMIGNTINLIDYEEAPGLSIPDWCGIINDKPYNYGSHIAPHDIEVRSMEIFGAPSRREIARNYNVDFDIVLPRISIQEGINAIRVLLDRCRFDEVNCERGLVCLKETRPTIDKNGYAGKNPIHNEYSHGADAFRYLALGVEEVRSYRSKVFNYRNVDSVSPSYNPLD